MTGSSDPSVAWPDGLVAFWDFAEQRPPFKAKEGTAVFPLHDGPGANVGVVDDGPFGQAAVFDGTADYLSIPTEDVGALNVGKYGDQCTVLAWIYREKPSYTFVAGLWDEDDVGDPHRQYGLFLSLPEADGERVCGHISSTGAATPRYGHCRELACGVRQVKPGQWRMVGLTYDGTQIISYLDGLADHNPKHTDELGMTYSRNPYAFTGGLNPISKSDFTVGASHGGKKFDGVAQQGVAGFWPGRIGGLAVFSRALSQSEIMQLHLATVGREPVVCYDFWRSTGYGAAPATTVGWQSARGPQAAGTGDQLDSANFLVTAHIGHHFLYRSAMGMAENQTQAGIGYTENMAGVRASQLSAVTFRMNNALAADTVRLCLRVGHTWYASNDEFSVSDDGRTGFEWMRAETKTFTMSRQAHTWRTLAFHPGANLSLGDVITSDIPDGELTAIGFYNPGLADLNSAVRITDVKVFATP